MKLTKADILRSFGVPEDMDLKPYEALVADVQLEEKGLVEAAFAEVRMTPDGNIIAEIGFWHEMPVEAPQPGSGQAPEEKMPDIALLPAKLLPKLPEGVAMGKNLMLPAGMLIELLNNQDYAFATGKELDDFLAAAQAAESQLEQPVGEVLPVELLPAEIAGKDTKPQVIVPAGIIRALLDAGKKGCKLELNSILPLVLANMIAKSAPKKEPEAPRDAAPPRTHLGNGSFLIAGFAQVENDRFVMAETTVANKPMSHADYYVPRIFTFFRHVAAKISTGVNFEIPDVFRDAIMGRLPAETGVISWRRTQDPASVPAAKVRRRIGFLANKDNAEEIAPPVRRGSGHPRMRLLGDVLEPKPENEF